LGKNCGKSTATREEKNLTGETAWPGQGWEGVNDRGEKGRGSSPYIFSGRGGEWTKRGHKTKDKIGT